MEDLRRAYHQFSLERADLSASPIDQFKKWFDVAREAIVPEWLEINAMTLATSTPHGHVSARIVLLKKLDDRGFAFFSNYLSDKGRLLAINPQASLVFHWPHVERQVRVEGVVCRTDSATSDEYFRARPRASQIGAIVSPQSRPIANRTELETQAARLAEQFAEDQPIPRPEYWGGYLLMPQRMEFWQGRPDRLHDRFVYTFEKNQWHISRLAP